MMTTTMMMSMMTMTMMTMMMMTMMMVMVVVVIMVLVMMLVIIIIIIYHDHDDHHHTSFMTVCAPFILPGVLYHRWGKFDDAEKYYKKGLKLEPQSRNVLENLQKLERTKVSSKNKAKS